MDVLLAKLIALVKMDSVLSIFGMSTAMGLVKTMAIIMGAVKYDTKLTKRELSWLVLWEMVGMVIITIPIAVMVGLVVLHYTDSSGVALAAAAIAAIIGRGLMDSLIKVNFDSLMKASVDGVSGFARKMGGGRGRDYYDDRPRYEPYGDRHEPSGGNDAEYRDEYEQGKNSGDSDGSANRD